ncbi:FUN14 domain-containing protein 2-like [Sycon ciliatum]|uniref:FUN14 domain-containing protein 2-like n=1 Tax=Sycon ciliatum TaxID=27933 RepID=UPI0031F6ABBB|eukprot:scpid55010/ scgid16187/ 
MSRPIEEVNGEEERNDENAVASRPGTAFSLVSLGDQPVAVQVAAGAVPGAITGYVFKRVSTTAAAAVGGGLILIQLAARAGYVSINWRRLERDTKHQWEQVKEQTARAAVGTEIGGRSLQSWTREVGQFAKDNVAVSGGFLSGFLLGLASG